MSSLQSIISAAACLLVSSIVSTNAVLGADAAAAGSAKSLDAGAASAQGLSPDQFDAQFLIGPHTAQKLGYRFEWESTRLADPGQRLVRVDVAGDSAFALDSHNQLTRLRVDTGARLWSVPSAPPGDRILSVTRVTVDGRDVLGVFGEGAVQVLETSSGVQTKRHKLDKLASTEPVVAPPFLLYGSSSGQIVYHRYGVGYEWRANQLVGSIRGKPVAVGTNVLVASSGGTVLNLDLYTARQIWRKQLLDGVVASPAVGDGVAFVASLDQYLWALDLDSGRTVWKYFAKGPLETRPVLLGQFVYQQLPEEGLACFEAVPTDAPDGRRIWTAADVGGEILGQHRAHLVVWDAKAHTLTLVDAARGHVVERVSLPRVDHLQLSAERDGDLYASSADGRLGRLSAR